MSFATSSIDFNNLAVDPFEQPTDRVHLDELTRSMVANQEAADAIKRDDSTLSRDDRVDSRYGPDEFIDLGGES